MKLYEIDFSGGEYYEMGIYYCSMTPEQARAMRDMFKEKKITANVVAIEDSPGFHPFESLMAEWKEELGE